MIPRLTAILAALAILSLATPAHGQSQPPQHLSLTMTLAATTATSLPKMLVGICQYTIQNNDSGGRSIYFGWDATVSNAHGLNIPSGTAYTPTITYQSTQAGSTIWLYSVAGTDANAIQIVSNC